LNFFIVTHTREGIAEKMEYELVDLINLEELNKLTDNWTKLINLPMGIFDPYGNALVASGWLSVCTDFHRANHKTRERCRHTDQEMFNRLKAGNEFTFFKCPNGLVDTGSAIIIEGKYLGGLGFGQIFF
jgi:ligand-binding sensor protein